MEMGELAADPGEVPSDHHDFGVPPWAADRTPSSSSSAVPASASCETVRQQKGILRSPRERTETQQEVDVGDGLAPSCTIGGSADQTPWNAEVDGSPFQGMCPSNCKASTLVREKMRRKIKELEMGRKRGRASSPPSQLAMVEIVQGQNEIKVTLEIGHIVMDELSLEEMLDLEIPHDGYYDEFEKYLRARWPAASEAVVEHARALEELLDVCIVTGFSFSCKKANLYRIRVQFVGSIVDRKGVEPLPHHTAAIRDFPQILDVTALRRFIGTVNWVSLHLSSEYGAASKNLTKYMGKTPFPLDDKALKAIDIIKDLACKCIGLAVLDEAAALDGSRPLEMVADCSKLGWGATLYQANATKSKLNVLGQFSGVLSDSEALWPALRQETHAQRMGTHAKRKLIGRIPTICWTDHANVVRLSNSNNLLDGTLIRWVIDIESDGSRLRNLSGRSAKLADGLSRGPRGLDAELVNKARQIRNFSDDEYFDDKETDDLQPSCLPGGGIPHTNAKPLVDFPPSLQNLPAHSYWTCSSPSTSIYIKVT